MGIVLRVPDEGAQVVEDTAEVLGRRVVTLSAKTFAKLAQIGRDSYGGKHPSWTDRDYAVYAIAALVIDAEERV